MSDSNSPNRPPNQPKSLDDAIELLITSVLNEEIGDQPPQASGNSSSSPSTAFVQDILDIAENIQEPLNRTTKLNHVFIKKLDQLLRYRLNIYFPFIAFFL